METVRDSNTTPEAEVTTETAIPVVAEQAEVGVRRVTTGGVRVHKHVQEHEEVIDQPLRREKVDVRRIVRNEVVAGPLPVRQDGNTTIIPVVEEVLVVQKQWVLKEELHITKQRVEEREQQRVVLRREDAEVERFDAEGRSSPEAPDPLVSAIRARRPKLIRKNKIIK